MLFVVKNLVDLLGFVKELYARDSTRTYGPPAYRSNMYIAFNCQPNTLHSSMLQL